MALWTVSDAVGTNGNLVNSHSLGKVAENWGGSSNPKGSQGRPPAARSGRPIGGHREAIGREICKWRRGWDSNPRNAHTLNGFQDRRIRPLCHPSEPGVRA